MSDTITVSRETFQALLQLAEDQAETLAYEMGGSDKPEAAIENARAELAKGVS